MQEAPWKTAWGPSAIRQGPLTFQLSNCFCLKKILQLDKNASAIALATLTDRARVADAGVLVVVVLWY